MPPVVETLIFTEKTQMFQIVGNLDIRTCEHMFLGQLRMGARQAKNAPLGFICSNLGFVYILLLCLYQCFNKSALRWFCLWQWWQIWDGMILPDPSSIQHCSTTCLIMFKGALVRPSVMDDLLVILFSFSPLSYRLQLLIPHQLPHIPRTRLTWLLALGNPEHIPHICHFFYTGKIFGE